MFLPEPVAQEQPASTSGDAVAKEAALFEALALSLRRHQEPTLRLMLQIVQRRLGTENEYPDDVKFAQALAHQINNLRFAENMEQSLSSIEPIPESFGSGRTLES